MNLYQRLGLSYIRIEFRFLSSISKRTAAQKAFELFLTPKRDKRPPSEIFDEGEQLAFVLDGISIHGYRWNHKAGRKILIVHGFESSIANFAHYILPLTQKGYEVLAFDAPAHGRSGGRMITAPLFAKMITTIDKTYGPVQSFIGHSFGGLALSMALENIDHDEGYRVAFIAPATETRTAVDQFFNLLQLNEAVRKEFDKLIMELSGYPVEWFSIRRAIKNIKAQVLWLHDEDDLQTPYSDALKVKKENLPNVIFATSKGLGHSKIYRDAGIVKKILEFV